MSEGEAYLDIVWQQFRKRRAAYWSLWAVAALFVIGIFAPALASNVPFVFHRGGETIYPWFRALFYQDLVVDYVFNMALVGFIPWLILALATNWRLRRRGAPGRKRVARVALQFLGVTTALSVLFSVDHWPGYAEARPWFDPFGADGASAARVVAATIPALVGALVGYRIARRHEHTAPRAFLGAMCGAAVLLLLQAAVIWGPSLRPRNLYAHVDFSGQEFSNPQEKYGVFPPLPFGKVASDLDSRLQAPGFSLARSVASGASDAALIRVNQRATHWLGTTEIGADVLTQMIFGARVATTIGLVSVSIATAIGIVLGALAGYFGGWTDIIISRAIETVLVFPAFFLILILVALIGPSIYIIMVVLGITGWPGIARLIRGEVLKQRSLDYTTAAQALGSTHRRIVFRHILPNSLGPALVSIPFGITGAIVAEAGLSLLGFGARPPSATWGTLLNEAHHDYHNWWLVIFPSVAVFLTLTVLNIVGNALRDAIDPKLRV